MSTFGLILCFRLDVKILLSVSWTPFNEIEAVTAALALGDANTKDEQAIPSHARASNDHGLLEWHGNSLSHHSNLLVPT
jgi:hypothetical protein